MWRDDAEALAWVTVAIECVTDCGLGRVRLLTGRVVVDDERERNIRVERGRRPIRRRRGGAGDRCLFGVVGEIVARVDVLAQELCDVGMRPIACRELDERDVVIDIAE